MLEEVGKLYLELPGSAVSGTSASKNLIMLHEHRDLIVKIELPERKSFRLFSPEKPFYVPKEKKQISEYIFQSGQEIHIWLSKFHQTELEIQHETKNGWAHYSGINPMLYDAADYSPLLARPAPILFKVGPHGSPIGETIKYSDRGTTIPTDYHARLVQSHRAKSQLDCMSCHEPMQHQSDMSELHLIQPPDSNKYELLRKWEINKFPTITREEAMRSCHAGPQNPDCSWFVEILPTAELYRILPDKDAEIAVTPSDRNIYLRLIIDTIMLSCGEVADKHQLFKDLKEVNFKIIVQTLKNGITKKFIVFSGYSGTRHFINATKYGVANIKVATITANELTFNQLVGNGRFGAVGAFNPKTIAGKVLIVAVLVDTAEYFLSGDKDVARLFAKVSTTLLGAAIAGFLAPFIAAIVGSILVGVSAAAATITIVVGGFLVGLGIVVGITLNALGIEDYFYNIYKTLKESWESDIGRINYDDLILD